MRASLSTRLCLAAGALLLVAGGCGGSQSGSGAGTGGASQAGASGSAGQVGAPGGASQAGASGGAGLVGTGGAASGGLAGNNAGGATGGAGGASNALPVGWSQVFDIGPLLSQSPSSGEPTSAMSTNGDAFVTFIDDLNGGVWVRRHGAATNGFDAPVLLDPKGSYLGKVGVDAQGNAIVAYGDTNGDVRTRRFTPATAVWTDGQTIMPHDLAMKADLTGLIVTPSGYGIAVGSLVGASGSSVAFLTVFQPGQGWSPAVNPLPGLAPTRVLASAAELGSTLLIATVSSVPDVSNYSYLTLSGSSYTYDLVAGSGLQGSTVTLATTDQTLKDPAGPLAMDAQGTAWLVASGIDKTNAIAQPKMLASFSGGAWSPAAPFPVTGSQVPTLAVAPNGDAMVVWSDCGAYRIGNCTVGARRYVGGVWQPDVVSPVVGVLYSGPWAAVDNQGHAVALWENPNASTPVIMGFAFDPAAGWSTVQYVDTFPTNNVETPISDISVSFGPDGTALASWAGRASNSVQTVRAAFYRFR